MDRPEEGGSSTSLFTSDYRPFLVEYKLQNTKFENFWNFFCTLHLYGCSGWQNTKALFCIFFKRHVCSGCHFTKYKFQPPNFFATTSILQDGRKQGYTSQIQVREETSRETQSSPVEGVAVSSCCKCLCLNYWGICSEKEDAERRHGNVSCLNSDYSILTSQELINLIATW